MPRRCAGEEHPVHVRGRDNGRFAMEDVTLKQLRRPGCAGSATAQEFAAPKGLCRRRFFVAEDSTQRRRAEVHSRYRLHLSQTTLAYAGGSAHSGHTSSSATSHLVWRPGPPPLISQGQEPHSQQTRSITSLGHHYNDLLCRPCITATRCTVLPVQGINCLTGWPLSPAGR